MRGKSAQLKAGEYGFPPHASEATIVDMLLTHKVIEHRITVPEGFTSDMAVALIDGEQVLSGKSPVIPEGTLLPETYLFELGTSRSQILDRMHKAQTELLEKLWSMRRPNLPFQTIADALKLASIVEKETRYSGRTPACCVGLHQPAPESA